MLSMGRGGGGLDADADADAAATDRQERTRTDLHTKGGATRVVADAIACLLLMLEFTIAHGSCGQREGERNIRSDARAQLDTAAGAVGLSVGFFELCFGFIIFFF